MDHIRLIGLLLFITTITLALAAAATRTTHVQVNGQWMLQTVRTEPDDGSAGPESSTTTPAPGSTSTPYTDAQPGVPPVDPFDHHDHQHEHEHNWDYAAHHAHAELTTIPIAWPLLATGTAGLMLWFVQMPTRGRPAPKRRSATRRRR